MSPGFDLHGHRGARGLFPENTLGGFAAALALGVSALELDVAVTADDVVVVSHDPVLNPDITRDARGAWLEPPSAPIRSLTVAELRRHDIGRIRPGTAYAAAFPDQRPRDGARIPTLAELLALDPQARLTIEMKTFPDRPDLTVPPRRMADLVMATVEAAGAERRVVIQSFDWRGLRHLRRRRPGLPLAWLTQARSPAEQRLWWDGPAAEDFAGSVPRAVAAEGGPIWAPAGDMLSRNAVAEAHALGLRVVPWGVDDPAGIQLLIGWGVDGLITDRPDVARSQGIPEKDVS